MKRTPTNSVQGFSIARIDFCSTSRNQVLCSSQWWTEACRSCFFFITVFSFTSNETYKNNIKHWFNSKSDCYCWIQKILEPKWWKLCVEATFSFVPCMHFWRFEFWIFILFERSQLPFFPSNAFLVLLVVLCIAFNISKTFLGSITQRTRFSIDIDAWFDDDMIFERREPSTLEPYNKK